MNLKLTKHEKNWVLYDVANSAFTLLVATIMPIYFNSLATNAGVAPDDYLAFWGYATSITTVLVALFAPFLGTLSDLKGYKRIIFTTTLLLGIIGCVILGFLQSWLWFLLLFVFTKCAYSLSLVVYDSMLPDITTEERMDIISSHGYAWGYIGSCIPFVACLALVLMYDSIGITMGAAMAIAFAMIAVWWLACSLPLIRCYKQVHYVESIDSVPIKDSFKRLTKIFSELKEHKNILFFLIAFFFYIDGVYTIIDMATAYGQSLGLDTTGLLLALLVTQIVAFPSSLFFARLSKKVDNRIIIRVCIIAYFGISVFAIWLDSLLKFWILAVLVGMFQGTIQAMSRSYFAKIIPAERSGEYFGIYDICGKGAAFAGTMLVSVITQLTNSPNMGVGSLAFMFLFGFIFFMKASK